VKYIPNIISLLRVAMFFIAGASDGLDGYLARRFGWVSRLGSLLDPLADKLLMTAIYFTLGMKAYLPVWLVALVIGRDLVIITGALAYRLLVKEITMQHLLISKLNTAAQILLVLVLIFKLSTFPYASHIPQVAITFLIYCVTFTTVASGVAYVVIWSMRARKQLKAGTQ